MALVNVELYDEGIRLYGGMRVLEGARPYHDFFAYYGPAEFYWPAALFSVFGEELAAARLGAVFVIAGAVWALSALLSRAGVGWAGVCFATAATLLPLSTIPIYALDPSLALALGAAAIVAGGTSTRRLLVAGALVGAASTFRHDFGVYAAAAMVVQLAVGAWERGAPRAAARVWLRRVLIVAGAAAAVALIVYGPLLARGFRTVWECLVSELARLMEYRKIPYRIALGRILRKVSLGGPSWVDELRAWVMLAPPTVLLTLLALLAPGVRRDVGAERPRAGVLAFLATFALGLSVYATGRSDQTHAYPMHVVVMGLLAVVGAAALRVLGRPRLGLALSAALSLVVLGALTFDGVQNWQEWHALAPAPFARARGIRTARRWDWLGKLQRDVRRYAGDKPIFVGSNRHDRVHKNVMTAYFFAGRASATYYHDLLPGLTTTEPVQRRMIADLEASHATMVLIAPTKLPTEPNLSASVKGPKLFDQYLASHFKQAADRGAYRLLVRNPE